jgi:hypothetical protein
MPLDDYPAYATPMITSESPTHIVITVEIPKAFLIGYGDCLNSSLASLNRTAVIGQVRVKARIWSRFLGRLAPSVLYALIQDGEREEIMASIGVLGKLEDTLSRCWPLDMRGPDRWQFTDTGDILSSVEAMERNQTSNADSSLPRSGPAGTIRGRSVHNQAWTVGTVKGEKHS